MRLFLVALSLILLVTVAAGAAVLSNKVSVTLKAKVTHDSHSGLYTYQYTVVSDSSSVREVTGFYLITSSNIINITSPKGWEPGQSGDGSYIRWAASAEEGFVIPPGYVDDGNLLPSIYQIKPGTQLSGFSFQSLDPPVEGIFYAEGFARIPVEGVDFPPGEEPSGPGWPDNLFKGSTKLPAKPKKG